ncbi:hypothetical protein [Methylobacterium aquaticum]|uniref:hypothetical protein n=1 Tax=Methylobacterium aquaticum TaxID=270351 RepID=UPI001931485D|nr:hypothetical protein [Methylobacterium aquaticum]QRE74222.1 hypothetical protein F1D61_11930 [Methylobacterium aquaticum]
MNQENKAIAALTSRIVAGAVANANPHDEARDMVELLVSRNVKADDEGNIKILDENGGHRISTRPGYPSMTIEEYIDEIKASRPMLFRSPGTSLASAINATAPAIDIPMAGNPFKEGPFFSITKQMMLMKNDPAKAQQLRIEANR